MIITQQMQKLLITTLLAAIVSWGCSAHKPEIQQGNVITDEMVQTLEIGMTQDQVRFVMGSPAIRPAFRQNRWDYIYTLNSDGDLVERRHLVLTFDGDKLSAIDQRP